MDVAIVGLGRMGSGVAKRLLDGGHAVRVYNRTASKSDELAKQGATALSSLQELVKALPAPRTIWMYLPSGETTREHADELLGYMEKGDVLIDGGNSNFQMTLSLSEAALKKGVTLLDVGTSGGLAGKDEGYCLMIGGDKSSVERLASLWGSVAQKEGYQWVGPSASGHYVKMVHNAIEYGMMQAYAEGMELLASSQFGKDLDLAAVTEVWQHGSIIRSYIGQLLNEAMEEDSSLSTIGARIDDNGEGRWSIEEGLRLGVPTPVITASLYARYQSRIQNSYAYRVAAVIRHKFGGHALAPATETTR
ncbi:MAG: decarboxylating 6-phosphogluconate dehydrogenase [bacterium]